MSELHSFRILLFARLRQLVGSSEISIELPAPVRVEELRQALIQRYPQLTGELTSCRVALDHEFVGEGARLRADAEIALIPPVSGGHDGSSYRVGRCVLSSEPLSLAQVVAGVEHAGAGGISTFTGNVREHNRGREIKFIDYEAYGPMAAKKMHEIAEAIEVRLSGTRVAIHHRYGHLVVGDTAVIIAASAPHRAEAFDACRAAIEELKREVPIWKREVDVDGGEEFGRGP